MLKFLSVGDYTLKELSVEEKIALLTGDGFWTAAEIAGGGIRFTDGPSGVRMQKGKGDCIGLNKSQPASCFPSHSSLSCSWNRELVFKAGKAIGEEASFFGADVLLAPALNLKRNPLCGRNFEYFSEDSYLNGAFGAAFVNGVQSSGTAACIKHFAANNREFARTVCDSVVDERVLRELYLTPFEIAVKRSSPAAVMTSYNRLNGVYCSENKSLIDGVLRNEWGFCGAVISDWGGTPNRVGGIKAGLDLEMPACRLTADEVGKALTDGELAAGDIDMCASRILKLAGREKKTPDCDFALHSRIAEEIAAECAVLLKNDGALPLSGDEKILLLGAAAKRPPIQGGGSSKVNPNTKESLYTFLKDKIFAYDTGYTEKRYKKSALRLAKKCGTVILCAGLYGADTEGADRKDFNFSKGFTALIEKLALTGKKIIVILFAGCAADLSWDGRADAILYAGLAGQGGAAALADILYGKINPSGKLTETFPLSTDDVPSSKYFGKDPYAEIYGEGFNTAYAYFRDKKVKYPFGFGLSYTEFKYENLSLSDKGAEFDVINCGKVYGGEIAQMYIRYPESANSSSIALKGFEKVFLNAGAKKRVFIPFDEYSFRSFDVSTGKYVEVSGGYEILIGASSKDIRLKGEIKLNGDAENVPAPQSALQAAEYVIRRNGKGRVIADLSTPFCELKNARGRFGRFFSKAALFFVRRNKAAYGSLEYLPLRALSQFGKMRKSTIDGLIEMFNGKFFKGLFKIIFRRCDNG